MPHTTTLSSQLSMPQAPYFIRPETADLNVICIPNLSTIFTKLGKNFRFDIESVRAKLKEELGKDFRIRILKRNKANGYSDSFIFKLTNLRDNKSYAVKIHPDEFCHCQHWYENHLSSLRELSTDTGNIAYLRETFVARDRPWLDWGRKDIRIVLYDYVPGRNIATIKNRDGLRTNATLRALSRAEENLIARGFRTQSTHQDWTLDKVTGKPVLTDLNKLRKYQNGQGKS